MAVVQYLIETVKADIAVQDNNGNTALHTAARGGQEEVVRLLLAAGADPAATNKMGDTPLHVAAKGGHEEVLRVLLAAGAEPSATNSNGRTFMEAQKESAFLRAAECGDLAEVQLAVETHKLDPNQCKDDDVSASDACCERRRRVLRRLETSRFLSLSLPVSCPCLFPFSCPSFPFSPPVLSPLPLSHTSYPSPLCVSPLRMMAVILSIGLV